ncbi:hypothetical protein [Paraburkholderia sp. 32]|uniref:hypothetical protein n=1 Tax=Paraburkholderia sp. 32 TaxID=2991057 RepID=UPI003D22437A
MAYVPGAELGMAWDLLEQRPIGNFCLEPGPAPKPVVAGTGFVDYESLTGTDQFDQDMSLDVKGQAVYGAGSYQARLTMARFLSITQDELSVRARIVIPMRQTTLTPAQNPIGYRLTPHASGLANDPLAFRRECGDGFVYLIQDGGVLEGMLRFHNLKRTERDQLRGSVKGEFPLASGSADISTSLNHYYSEQRLTIHLQSQGPLRTLRSLSPSGFQKALDDYATSVTNENAARYSMIVKGYSGFVTGSPQASGGIIDEASRINFEITRQHDLSAIISDILEKQSSYILSGAHKRRTSWKDSNVGGGIPIDINQEALKAMQRDIDEKYVPELERARDACRTSEGRSCLYPPDVPVDYALRTRLPVRYRSFPDDLTQSAYASAINIEYENMEAEFPTGHIDFCARKDAMWRTREARYYDNVPTWRQSLAKERYDTWIAEAADQRRNLGMSVPSFTELSKYQDVILDRLASSQIAPFHTKTCKEDGIVRACSGMYGPCAYVQSTSTSQ